MDIVRRQTPEQREMDRKKAELHGLEAMVWHQEQEFENFRASIAAFEKHYTTEIVTRNTQLSELREKISQIRYHYRPRTPRPAPKRKSPPKSASRPVDSASGGSSQSGFHPFQMLRDLYRAVARVVHPDRGDSDEDRLKREQFMIKVNEAYAEGDSERLAALLRQWEYSPDLISGEDFGAHLVRVIRKIAMCQERLNEIPHEVEKLKDSPMYQLMEMSQQAAELGRDLLAERIANLDGAIAEAEQELERVSRGEVA